ncbi:MAG: hypothetical protein ACE5LB_13210 [Acidiferrobacterales bacterium]
MWATEITRSRLRIIYMGIEMRARFALLVDFMLPVSGLESPTY